MCSAIALRTRVKGTSSCAAAGTVNEDTGTSCARDGPGDATRCGAFAPPSAAAITSSLVTRPPAPVPRIDARSTPRSRASLRTSGESAPPSEGCSAAGAGGACFVSAGGSGLGSGAGGFSSAFVASLASSLGASAFFSSFAGFSSFSGASGVGAEAFSPSLADSSITAISAPTSTVSSCPARIFVTTPDAGDGSSVSILSVEISTSGSSSLTYSPSCFSQRMIVPSTTLSPIFGSVTEVVTKPSRRSQRVQRAPRQREGGFAEGFRKRRVRVNQGGDLFRHRFPADRQHRLGHQLGHARADEVNTEHAPAFLGDDLAEPVRLQDDGLPDAGQLHGLRHDVEAFLARLTLRHTHRSDLGRRVRRARNGVVVDWRRGVTGKLLGHVHAFAERDVSQTRRVDAVADGVDAGRRGLELLVDLDEPALIDRDTGGVEAGVFRHRAASNGDEQHLREIGRAHV